MILLISAKDKWETYKKTYLQAYRQMGGSTDSQRYGRTYEQMNRKNKRQRDRETDRWMN